MTRALLAVGVVVLVAATGCGGGGNATSTELTTTTTATTTTSTTTPSAETTAFRVYFLRKGQVWPVARQVQKTQAVASAALDALLQGPTKQERTDLQLTTAIPEVNPSIERLAIDKTTGIARYSPATTLDNKALAQVVYTLTQFSTVKSVEVGGKRYTRADFEAQTPTILVESPLSFQDVSSPLRVTGTANTFEATFQYELTDTDGKIVDSHFVTATSGTGTRGTFDFTTNPFTVPFDGVGELIVFELSAKDGSRIHLQEIPLRMKR